MKRFLILAIAILIFGCSNAHSQRKEYKALEYRNGKDEFTILVIIESRMSAKTANQKALTQAAKTSKKYGYKSFDIKEEMDVEVMIGKTNWPNANDFPQNLYQEEIIDDGYNREKIISGSKSDYKLQKAYRIKVKAYFSNSKGSHKVCDIIKC